MKTSKNSIAMHYAHILYGKQITTNTLLNATLDWKNAVKLAWYFVGLREKLRNGIVTFTFCKQDGSIREAKGTLHGLLIPEDKKPKGDMSDGAAKPNYKSIAYFDLDKQEWRAFSIDKFIGFVTVYEIKESKVERQKSKDKREK